MRYLILATALLLSACTVTEPKTVAPPVFHPTLPTPLQACPIEWKVLIVENQPYVALTYNNNITAAMCFNEYERYIHQLLRVTCSYREKLNEQTCINLKREQLEQE